MFKALLLSNFGKDSSIVFIGTLINVIAGGAFFILAPRVLGPSDYGLFSTVIATGLLATAIANFGIDTGILRFASKKNSELKSIFSLAFKSYIFLGLTAAIVGFAISQPLANFLSQPIITTPFKIALLSTIFLLMTNFFVAALQAKGEFLKASLVNISSNVARLILTGLLFYFYRINLLTLTAIFFLVPIISTIVGKILFPLDLTAKSKTNLAEFHKYNFWIAAGLILSSVPFDNYLLLKLSGPAQVGLYAAPFKLLTISYQFGGNFTRVLASKLTSFDTDKKVIDFTKAAIVFPAVFIVGLMLIMALSPFSVSVLGKQYLGVPAVVNILAVGFMIFFLSTIPSSIILYYFGKARVSFIITAARYLLFLTLLITLIPKMQSVGAAIAFSLSELASFLMMSLYVLFVFAKNK